MVNKVQTLYGDLDEKDLKKLNGYLDEMILHFSKRQTNADAIKDIVSAAHDDLKLPKKIIRDLAKTKYKNSFESDVSEFKEYEAIFTAIRDLK